ncbi:MULTISPECIES: hypothetical protein [Aeromicrobium]|uniref:hypothetical protein n=1 Tax=Aeromicrobium TaxID=2040 RepID=UPI001CA92093|nr:MULTISPECIES: hypothetical protein [Aeromicrobium]
MSITSVDPLDLPGDLEGLAEEVDVAELNTSGLAEPEAREGTERDERLERLVCDCDELTDLLRRRDRHGRVSASASGESDTVGRI